MSGYDIWQTAASETNVQLAADETVVEPEKEPEPLVSLIIPIYRVAPYVRKCLASVASQTYSNIETILINDATPDDSMVAAIRAAATVPNLRVVNLTENRGLSGARNEGMKAATGKYIFFLDSDDWLAEGAIEKAVKKAELGDSEVVIVDYYRANINGHLVRAKDRTPYKQANLPVFNPTKHQNALQILNLAQIKLYNRDFLIANEFEFTKGVIYEDIDWTFKILTTATRVAIVNEPLYFYRTARPGSILTTPGKQHFDVLWQYERVFKFLSDNDKQAFFVTIYNYAVNAVYSVLLENSRIPEGDRAEFFDTAKKIFKTAKAGRKFEVTLYGRGWFEAALLGKSYAKTESIYRTRLRNARRNKSETWQWFKKTWVFRAGVAVERAAISTVNSTSDSFKLARKKLTQAMERNAHELIRKLPLKNSVVFESYWGQQYADSPKYLYEYIKKNYPEVKCYYSLKKNVKADVPAEDRLRWASYQYHIKLATSKVFVNNNNFTPSFRKPAGGLFIQTFHGIPIKYIGTDMIGYEDGGKTNWGGLVERCSMWDYFISSSAHHTEAIRGAFHSKAQFLEVGSPRTDCLQCSDFVADNRSKIRAHFGLPANSRILLYAPTWRLASPKVFLSQSQLETIAENCGDEVYILARQHHMSKNRIVSNARVKDASDYPDSQDLCAAADIMITDYSSIAFDFAVTGNPALFFIPDYDQYRKVRGLYFDMEKNLGSLTHRHFEDLVEATARLLRDPEEAIKANSMVFDQFLEAERGDSCKYVVENLILPHLGISRRQHGQEGD